MSIKINFDASHNPEQPTLILSTRNGTKLGCINARNIILKDSAASELTFKVNKYVDGKEDELWDKIKSFKLVWCKEWDVWFEVYVEVDESDNTQKIVNGIRLGVAELSQAVLYGVQINTEDDIAREDYVPTVLYNSFKPEGSLLHRIMREKAQHYKFIHVDSSIANIQRTFKFDGVSIYDAFQQISEEIGCVFVLHSNSDENGNIQRTISVYDAHSICNTCHYRGDFIDVCPECGSTDVVNTYGEDTTIFITADDLTDSIQFTSDTGAIKNCFKLEGGDDLMTATIKNCNPNGTDSIWRFSNEAKEDMSTELVERIKSYDDLNQYYQQEYTMPLDSSLVDGYNELVERYSAYNPELEKIEPPVVGYPELMNVYYNVIDLSGYLQTVLMPSVEMSETNAAEQAALLTRTNLSPIAVSNLDYLSEGTAANAVMDMGRCLVDDRYQIKVNESSLNVHLWTGNFVVTNYSDEKDTAISNKIYVEITDEYKTYIEQKIYKALAKTNDENVSITGLFDLNYDRFCAELKKYGLDSLKRFLNCCQGCLDVMIEGGIADGATWKNQSQNLYDELYVPYYRKLQAIEAEISVRESEINILEGVFDANGGVIKKGLITELDEIRANIQSELDFQKYLGEDLWLEFCAYRRDDKYSNSNFISDGLTNAELFSRALEFLKLANEELYRSSELQHSVTVSSLKNFLLIDKFKGFAEHFELGNWMRVLIDGTVYKLRLVDYEIDYDAIENISVTFSDVINTANGLSSVQTAVDQMHSMSSSYDSTQRQAADGADSKKYIKTWFEDGLDVTNTFVANNSNGQVQTWDEHGMLFRAYDPVTEMYSDIQMKIINSTLVVTDDNWEHVKTAIGLFYYVDPIGGEVKQAYGINAEMVIGKMILGQSLGLYTDTNSLIFDENGLQITNGTNTFTVNPNDEKLLKLSNNDEDVLWVDEHGGLHIVGDGSGIDIEANDYVQNMNTRITQNAEAITLESHRASEAEGQLDAKITINAESIESEVQRATKEEGILSSRITQTAEEILSEVEAADGELRSYIDQTATSIRSEVADTKEGLETSIEQTADAIRSEVAETKRGLESSIEQTATSIRSEVSDAKKELESSITQTAADIREEVSDIQKGLQASIDLNTDAITSEVSRAKGKEDELSTTITQTAKDIRAEVNDIQKDLQASIDINAKAISSEVSRAKGKEDELSTLITQTATDIRAEVKDIQDELQASIELNADKISSEVSRAKGREDELSSLITQTATDIRAEVNDIQDGLQASIDLNTKSIEAEVKRAKAAEASITVTADEISTSVSNLETNTKSWIEQSAEDVTLAFEAADDELSGKITASAESLTAAFKAADDDLSSKITASAESLTAAFQAADDKLSGQITASAESLSAAFKDADSELSGQITTSAAGLRSEFQQADSALQSSISQNASGIASLVEDVGGLSSSITQQAGQISTLVTNMDGLSSRITQNANEIASLVTGVDGLSSSIKQQSDRIDMLVGDVDTALTSISVLSNEISSKVSSGEVESLIEQKADSIRLKAGTIAWESSNSSMSAEGILTCNNATINGTIASDMYKIYSDSKGTHTPVIQSSDYDYSGVVGVRMGLPGRGCYVSCKIQDGFGIMNLVGTVYLGSGGSGELHGAHIYATQFHGGFDGTISNAGYATSAGSAGTATYAGKAHALCASDSDGQIMVYATVNNIYPLSAINLGTSSNPWDTAFVASVTQTSDKRLKENIAEFTEVHEAIYMDLRPVSFKFRNVDETTNHDRTHYGFIAQEVETNLKNHGLTSMDCGALCKDYVEDFEEDNQYEKFGINDCLYSFRYGEIVALNTHMTQKALRHQNEQDNLIAQQTEQINELTQMNLMLLNRISKLEKLMNMEE